MTIQTTDSPYTVRLVPHYICNKCGQEYHTPFMMWYHLYQEHNLNVEVPEHKEYSNDGNPDT